MESNATDLGWWTGLAALVGVLAGWLGGAGRAVWGASKYDSRLKALEDDAQAKKLERAKEKEKEDEEDLASRVGSLEQVILELKVIPSMVTDIKKTTDLLERVIFQERGGLNVVTHDEHDKMQAQCQTMFRKDLDQLKFMMEQLIKSSGTEQLEVIAKTLNRLEKEFASRIRLDRMNRVDG